MRRLAMIFAFTACMPLLACAAPSETRFRSALEEAARLMTYSHDREATGQRLADAGHPAEACPNFRAAAARAEAAANAMRQAGHPDDVWADANGWGKALAGAVAQRDAMQLRARQVCA